MAQGSILEVLLGPAREGRRVGDRRREGGEGVGLATYRNVFPDMRNMAGG
jgi:hypothetical protein